MLAYANDLGLAADFFVGIGVGEWSQLDTPAIMRYETSLGPGIARSTAQRRISCLRSFLKFLKKNGEGPSADLPSTGGFRKPKAVPKALSSAKLEALLNAPDLARPTGMRDRALLELIYGAGLRVSEAVELEFEAINLDERAVRITGKRGKTRYVPLPAQTVDWIRRYLNDARPQLAKRASSRIILSDQGKPMLRQTVYTRLQGMAKRAGIEERISPHTIRHTYAVHLIKGGADLRAVQELLGHESIATTQVYTQLDLEEVRKRYRDAHPRK